MDTKNARNNVGPTRRTTGLLPKSAWHHFDETFGLPRSPTRARASKANGETRPNTPEGAASARAMSPATRGRPATARSPATRGRPTTARSPSTRGRPTTARSPNTRGRPTTARASRADGSSRPNTPGRSKANRRSMADGWSMFKTSASKAVKNMFMRNDNPAPDIGVSQREAMPTNFRAELQQRPTQPNIEPAYVKQSTEAKRVPASGRSRNPVISPKENPQLKAMNTAVENMYKTRNEILQAPSVQSRIKFLNPTLEEQKPAQSYYATLASQRYEKATAAAEEDAFHAKINASNKRAQKEARDREVKAKAEAQAREADARAMEAKAEAEARAREAWAKNIAAEEARAQKAREEAEARAREAWAKNIAVAEARALKARELAEAEARARRGRSKRTAAQTYKPFDMQTINYDKIAAKSCGSHRFNCDDRQEGSYGCFFSSKDFTWQNLLTCNPSEFKVHAPAVNYYKWIKIDSDKWQEWAREKGLGIKVFKTKEGDPSPLLEELEHSRKIVEVLKSDYTTFVPYQDHIGFRITFNKPNVSIVSMFNGKQASWEGSTIYVIPSTSCVSDMHAYRVNTITEYNGIATNLFNALKILHSNGYIHHDVKPNNMVMCPGSTGSPLKLIDFGHASHLDRINPTFTGGTRWYVSPIFARWVSKGAVFSKQEEMEMNINNIIRFYKFSGQDDIMIRDLVLAHVTTFEEHFKARTNIPYTPENLAQFYRVDYRYFVNLIYPKTDMFAAALTMIVIAKKAGISLKEIIEPLITWVVFP